MKRIAIILSMVFTVGFMTSSCSEQEESTSFTIKKSTPVSVEFDGDIGYYNSNTWTEITLMEFENFIQNTFGLSVHPTLSGIQVISLEIDNQTVYMLEAVSSESSFSIDVNFDGSTGNYSIAAFQSACKCDGPSCSETECQAKKDAKGEWYCSDCTETCTKTVVAVSDPEPELFQ